MRGRYVVPLIFATACFSKPGLRDNPSDGGTDSPPSSTCDFVQQPGLVAYLPFDSVEGTATLDRSQLHNDGVLHGALEPVPGRAGMALQWSAQNQYVDLGSAASLDQLPALTACMWLQPSGSIDAGTLLDKSVDGIVGGWNLYATPQAGSVGLGFVTRSALFEQTSGVIARGGPWAHACVSWDGSDGTLVGQKITGVHLWVDGAEALPSYAVDSYRTSPSNDGARPLRIGSGVEGGTDYTFRGAIDEVVIFDRELDATEIAAIRDCAP